MLDFAHTVRADADFGWTKTKAGLTGYRRQFGSLERRLSARGLCGQRERVPAPGVAQVAHRDDETARGSRIEQLRVRAGERDGVLGDGGRIDVLVAIAGVAGAARRADVHAGDVAGRRVLREVRREAGRRGPVPAERGDHVAVVGEHDVKRGREAAGDERSVRVDADVELVRLRDVAGRHDLLARRVDVVADERRFPVREHRQVRRIDFLLHDLVGARARSARVLPNVYCETRLDANAGASAGSAIAV